MPQSHRRLPRCGAHSATTAPCGEYWGFVHVGRAHLARDRQEKPYAVVDTEKRAGSEELVKVWTKGGSHYLTVDESRQS